MTARATTRGSASQTGYVRALQFGLVPDALRSAAFSHLVADVVGRGYHLSTGFLGTPYLLSVWRDGGRADVANRVLTQTSYPSWGYEIGLGATTVGERWDGIRPDGTFQDPAMNSFKHYGLGSIGDYLYNSAGALAPTDSAPGYRRFVVAPAEGSGIDGASTSVKTAYGLASSTWKRDASGRLTIDVTVPIGSAAELRVSLSDGQQVLEGGLPAAPQPGVIRPRRRSATWSTARGARAGAAGPRRRHGVRGGRRLRRADAARELDRAGHR